MTQSKQKAVSVYIKKIASGNYQLFTATGLATARSLNASMIMEVR